MKSTIAGHTTNLRWAPPVHLQRAESMCPSMSSSPITGPTLPQRSYGRTATPPRSAGVGMQTPPPQHNLCEGPLLGGPHSLQTENLPDRCKCLLRSASKLKNVCLKTERSLLLISNHTHICNTHHQSYHIMGIDKGRRIFSMSALSHKAFFKVKQLLSPGTQRLGTPNQSLPPMHRRHITRVKPGVHIPPANSAPHAGTQCCHLLSLA